MLEFKLTQYFEWLLSNGKSSRRTAKISKNQGDYWACSTLTSGRVQTTEEEVRALCASPGITTNTLPE